MEDFDQLVRAFTGQVPTGAAPVFLPITAGSTYLMGTPIVSLGGRQAQTDSGLFVVLFGEDDLIPFMGVYMTFSEYSGVARGVDKRELVNELSNRLSMLDRKSLIRSLGQLWELWNHKETRPKLIEHYVRSLSSEDATRIRNLLNTRVNPRVFLSKQLIVQTMAEALRVSRNKEVHQEPNLREVVEICHLMAEKFGSTRSSEGPIVMGTPEFDEVSLSLTSNLYFNSTEDDLARMARAWRLWNTDNVRVRRELKGETPAEIFLKVMDYSIEVHFALVMSLYVQICPDGLQKSVVNAPQPIENYRDAYDHFLSELITSAEDESFSLDPAESEWDIGILHSKPIIQIAETEYVVTNHDNVMNRVTSDLVLNLSPRVDSELSLHTNALVNAWGHVIEEYVTSAFGNITTSAELMCWTEEEMVALFPGDGIKRPDFVLLDGNCLLVIEVMSRGIAGRVQKSQDAERYRIELQKGILDKCEQVSESMEYILTDTSRMGISTPISIVVPVIVSGSGLSSSRVLQAEIDHFCQQKKIFDDRRIRRPVCLDLGEVEMLEALVENGASVASTLLHWFSSEFSSTSLKNYAVTLRRENPEQLRSVSLKHSFDRMVESIMKLIELN